MRARRLSLTVLSVLTVWPTWKQNCHISLWRLSLSASREDSGLESSMFFNESAGMGEAQVIATLSDGSVEFVRSSTLDHINKSFERIGKWQSLHRGAATAISVQNDRKEVASAGEDGNIFLLYPTSDRSNTRKIQNAESTVINALKYASLHELVSCGMHVRVYDVRQQLDRPSLTMRDTVSGRIVHTVSVHPSQPDVLVSGVNDGALVLWDRRNPRWPLQTFMVHQANVWEAHFHKHNPDILGSCGEDRKFVLLDLNCTKRWQGFAVDEDNISNQVYADLSPLALNSFDFHSDTDMAVIATDSLSVVFLSNVTTGMEGSV